MSTPVDAQPWATSSSKQRVLPKPPTRKPPPSPLAISSSSVSTSRLQLPTVSSDPSPALSTSTNAGRNSLDSSRSDLTSVRSEITSRIVSEFPIPPSALPPIPASPRTPMSLHFSTTPRSQSPQSGFAYQQQQRSPIPTDRQGAGSPFANPNPGYDLTQDGSGRYSEYAMYKEQNAGASTSRPMTPATAGTMTPRDWPSSDGRSSPLQPPRPAYAGSRSPAGSPLRNGSFATQQDERPHTPESPLPSPRSYSPSHRAPRSASPQPPRSPLPVPPRESARYSWIARNAGVADMGMDVSEEDLLSTDFISGLLNQPAASSPRSARFPRLPDSPRSVHFGRTPDSPRSPARSDFASEETHGLSGHIEADEMRLASRQFSVPNSLGFSGPKSVAGSDSGLLSPSKYLGDSSGAQFSGMDSPPPSSIDGAQWTRPAARRMQSGLASSVFPSGGDKVYQDFLQSPTLPTSPNTQSLAVPEHRMRSHASPHPLMPSTPMSLESFAASPRSPQGFAHAQARQHQRNSSASNTVAAHLPIGNKPLSNATRGAVSPRMAVSPKIRQHHYPRHGGIKKGPPPKDQAQESTQQLQSMTYPPHAAASTSTDTKLSDGRNDGGSKPLRSTITSMAPSASSSTRTQRNSSLGSPRTVETDYTSSGVAIHSDADHAPATVTQSRPSMESSYQTSTENGLDDDGTSEIEGQVQTASRVLGAVSPVIMRPGEAEEPTMVGLTSTLFSNRDSVEPHELESAEQDHLEVAHTAPGLAMASPPLSPRDPPSVHSPPAHLTDMPESVKSNVFSDDVHGTQRLQTLHYGQVPDYGSSDVLRSVEPNASQISPSSFTPLGRRASKQASSFKSVVSYITTRSRTSTLASKSSKRSNGSSRWHWLKRKPLPPLPPSATVARTESAGYESGLQTPALAQRASDLRAMLERDQHPATSRISLPRQGEPQGWSEGGAAEKGQHTWHDGDMFAGPPGMTFVGSGGKFDMLAEDSLKVAKRNKAPKQRDSRKRAEAADYESKDFSSVPSSPHRLPFAKRFHLLRRSNKSRKWFWFPLIAVVIILVIISIALGTTLGRKQSSNKAAVTCNGPTAGARCNLDATCICPSSKSGVCSAPLAQALVQVVPVASRLFATNITDDALALALWETLGTPADQSCVSQAALIDVGSVLDDSVSPNRTQWAQAALLWSLFQTGNIESTKLMQEAVSQLPFQSLKGQDGPQGDPSNKFNVNSSGYIFNFAAQTVNAQPLKFQNDGSPSPAQLGETNSVTLNSLDRMYSLASASSTQRQSALATHWQSVLSLKPEDLQPFLVNFKSAPVLLPFDATASPGGQSISTLLTNAINRTLSFPPSLGCSPGLTASQLQRISTVESSVFGLPTLTSSPSSFDSSCFANRPVYGVLDVLHTRLPFSDSRAGVAKQAAILTSDASKRAVLHVGELLSALPAANNTDLSSFALNPRQFGTLNHVNHIALEWLQAFPTPAMAVAAAKFVLSSPSSPPSSNSTMFNSTSIPIVEVAVFGTILLSDLSAFVSSFSTPSGGLFFGSPQGDAFRHWALQQSSPATITWSENSYATSVVNETSSLDNRFENIWSGAASLISRAAGGTTGPNEVSEVVSAFFPS